MVVIRAADGATAEVHHDGAHVTSWRPAPDGDERLFLSTRSVLREGAAIRGGIPVIFPQFAAEGPLPRHGFARTMRWTLDSAEERAGEGIARFTLSDSDATRAVWPAAFRASIIVRVAGSRLSVALRVQNPGDATIRFTAALHSYLRVKDVTRTAIEGLHGCRYRESSAPGVFQVDDSQQLHPSGELDRVYVEVERPLLVREPSRTLAVSATGFRDVVVWNPGAAKAAAMADMEPGGERHMLCLEAAAVQVPIALAAGEVWEGVQHFDAAGG